jgi:hypothetical protein
VRSNQTEAVVLKFSTSCLAAAAVLAVLVLPGGAEAFEASYSWAGIPACDKVSPAFKLSAVPDGTKRLRMYMTDLDAPMFHHGGSVLPFYGDDAVKKGAVSYVGPCPPAGQRHRYTWTIEALDEDGNVLGRANETQTFPP